MVELVVCTVFWGASFLAQKLGGDYLGAFSINCFRNVIAGLFLAGVLSLRRCPLRPTRTELVGGALSGICLFAAMMAQQIGIADTSPGVSAFLTANYVLLVPVFGLFLSRRPGWNVWGGVLLALAGTYCICIDGRSETIWRIGRGEAWTLLCSLAFAVQILVVERFARRSDMVRFSMIQMFVAGLVAFPFVFLPEELKLLGGGGLLKGIYAVLFLGVFSSGIAYTLQNLGQAKVSAALASIVMSLESVFAALFAWLLLGSQMTSRQLVGAALVLVAIVFSQIQWSRKK